MKFTRFVIGTAFGFALGFTAAVYLSPHKSESETDSGEMPASIAPEPAGALHGTVTGKLCSVEFSGVETKWAEAFAAIHDAAYEGYRETLGIDLPDYVKIELNVTGEATRLWTDGSAGIFLGLNSADDLLPSSQYRNIYGLCHEPGHIAMYSRMGTLAGMPDGIGEGWAHYAGSVVLDYVWTKLGENAWPVAHDFSKQGKIMLEGQCAKGEKDAVGEAACMFYALGETYGHDKVGQAMLSALVDKPSGARLMPNFKKAVAGIMGADAAETIPGILLVSEVNWQSDWIIRGKAPPAKFFATQKTNAEGWLSFNDGSSEEMRSIAGSGHAVLFSAPGGGKLAAVRLKGGRYGHSESDSVFRLTILDFSFDKIREFEFPFMAFAERTQELYWVELDTDGLKVPDAFFACFDFSPTANDGVYAGFDTSSSGNSFTALPDGHLRDFELGEWMIEAKLER